MLLQMCTKSDPVFKVSWCILTTYIFVCSPNGLATEVHIKKTPTWKKTLKNNATCVSQWEEGGTTGKIHFTFAASSLCVLCTVLCVYHFEGDIFETVSVLGLMWTWSDRNLSYVDVFLVVVPMYLALSFFFLRITVWLQKGFRLLCFSAHRHTHRKAEM